jgi:hypothetical protein
LLHAFVASSNSNSKSATVAADLILLVDVVDQVQVVSGGLTDWTMNSDRRRWR